MPLTKYFADLEKKLKTLGPIILKNPRRNTSTIVETTKDSIIYIRGKSRITLKKDLIIDAYKKYKGKTVSTTDLKRFNKSFKLKPCNATFFLMLMREFFRIPIKGRGVRGKPFYICL